MSKWVKVPITIYKVYVVEIKDSETVEDAEYYALDDLCESNTETGDLILIENEHQIESIKQLADEILSI